MIHPENLDKPGEIHYNLDVWIKAKKDLWGGNFSMAGLCKMQGAKIHKTHPWNHAQHKTLRGFSSVF